MDRISVTITDVLKTLYINGRHFSQRLLRQISTCNGPSWVLDAAHTCIPKSFEITGSHSGSKPATDIPPELVENILGMFRRQGSATRTVHPIPLRLSNLALSRARDPLHQLVQRLVQCRSIAIHCVHHRDRSSSGVVAASSILRSSDDRTQSFRV